MRRVSFEIYGSAVPWRAPRVVRRGDGHAAIKPRDTARWQDFVRLVATQHAPPDLLEGALCLYVEIWREIPRSWPGWKRAAAAEGLVRPTTRPDSTNLLKAIEDALTGVIWRDDSQVTDTHVLCRYCTPDTGPHVVVCVREIALGARAVRADLEDITDAD